MVAYACSSSSQKPFAAPGCIPCMPCITAPPRPTTPPATTPPPTTPPATTPRPRRHAEHAAVAAELDRAERRAAEGARATELRPIATPAAAY